MGDLAGRDATTKRARGGTPLPLEHARADGDRRGVRVAFRRLVSQFATFAAFPGGGLFSDRGSRRTYRYLGDSTVDYYGAALSLGFDSSYPLAPKEPLAPKDPSDKQRDLVFTTVLTATYEYGVASVSGVRYAPASVQLDDISALTPVISDSVFGLWSLQISSSMSF